jgi:hypothetical protein
MDGSNGSNGSNGYNAWFEWFPQTSRALLEAEARVSELMTTVDAERAARAAASDELEAQAAERDQAHSKSARAERENA